MENEIRTITPQLKKNGLSVLSNSTINSKEQSDKNQSKGKDSKNIRNIFQDISQNPIKKQLKPQKTSNSSKLAFVIYEDEHEEIETVHKPKEKFKEEIIFTHKTQNENVETKLDLENIIPPLTFGADKINIKKKKMFEQFEKELTKFM